MADQGSGRAVPGLGDTEASAADIQEQLRAAAEEDADDAATRFAMPSEASEADAVEQLRAAPLDDDDWR